MHSTEETHEAYWGPGRIAAGVVFAAVIIGAVVFYQREHLRVPDEGHPPGAISHAQAGAKPQFNIENPQIPLDNIHRGGPPKDGIPALTDPQTVPIADADFLDEDDRVVGVTIHGESRAYPIRVLNHHEAYNDTLGGVPIVVVYCPLCDSVTVADRRLGDHTYEFGISGLLSNSNVLLYDRKDDALWSQARLTAVTGPNAGKSLRHLGNWTLGPFSDFAEAQPDATVTTLDTGHARDYTADGPYGVYFESDNLWFPAEPADDRFANKTRVIGLKSGEQTRAYPIETIRAAPGGVVEDEFAGQTVTLRVDSDTGTVAVGELPDGVAAIHTFWFAWYAYHPGTGVYEGDAE